MPKYSKYFLFLQPTFSDKPNIKRLFQNDSWELAAFHVSHLSGMYQHLREYLQTPRSSSTALQGFSSYHAGVTVFLQTWLYRPLGGPWQAGRSYGVDSSFLFPDPSLSQTLRRSHPDSGRRSWDSDVGTSSWFVCLRNYFPKTGMEKNQVPSWQREPLMRWGTADPLKALW